MRKLSLIAIAAAAAALPAAPRAAAGTVRDVAELKGVREHPISGVGLVVGLQGTGDKGRETQKRIAMLLKRIKFNVDPADLPSKNVALVFVTARVKSDAPKGTPIDVAVSSLGDATSLVGGQLLPVPLHTDKTELVLARAEGRVSVSVGAATAGTIAQGATLEKEIPSKALENFYVNGSGEKVYFVDLVLDAKNGDVRLASEIADAINTSLRTPQDAPAAKALTSNQVRVEVPGEYRDRRAAFVSNEIMNVPVVVDPPARVIINEDTGVVVLTGNVRLSEAQIRVAGYEITVRKDGTLEDLRGALKGLKVTSATLISVIKELARAGALQGKLVTR